MGQRQRIRFDFVGRDAGGEGEEGEEPMEVDGVKAMVAGVKSRGVSGLHSIKPRSHGRANCHFTG
jgi:hypothetical protein